MVFLDVIAMVLFCMVLCTPFVAYLVVEKYKWSGLAKLTIGAVIAAAISIVLIITGFAILFRNGGIC